MIHEHDDFLKRFFLIYVSMQSVCISSCQLLEFKVFFTEWWVLFYGLLGLVYFLIEYHNLSDCIWAAKTWNKEVIMWFYLFIFFVLLGVQPHRQARARTTAGLDWEAWIQGQIKLSSNISLFSFFSLVSVAFTTSMTSSLLKSVPSPFSVHFLLLFSLHSLMQSLHVSPPILSL